MEIVVSMVYDHHKHPHGLQKYERGFQPRNYKEVFAFIRKEWKMGGRIERVYLYKKKPFREVARNGRV